MLDLIRFTIAILPLAAYANVLGLLRMRPTPTVLSGAMDIVLLGLAAIGFIAIGPMELFFPRAAYSLLGVWVWVVLIALYLFILMLVALNTTQKIIVYGLDAVELRSQVCDALQSNQIEANWLGDVVEMPDLGIKACIEPAGRQRISQMVAAGDKQNLNGWLTFEKLLVQQVSKTSVNQRKQGWVWLAISLMLFGLAAGLVSQDLPRLKQAMTSMFERE